MFSLSLKKTYEDCDEKFCFINKGHNIRGENTESTKKTAITNLSFTIRFMLQTRTVKDFKNIPSKVSEASKGKKIINLNIYMQRFYNSIYFS